MYEREEKQGMKQCERENKRWSGGKDKNGYERREQQERWKKIKRDERRQNNQYKKEECKKNSETYKNQTARRQKYEEMM